MTKNKVLSCSTPDHHFNSVDSDSDSRSPVQFFCTQDGVEGEIEVVWNFYTPKSGSKIRSVPKNSTPVSSRARKHSKHKETDRPPTKRKFIRDPKKRNELLQELYELNKNLKDFTSKKPNNSDSQHESDEDIFCKSPEHSPKSGLRSNIKSLRKNLLSSKFEKTENEYAIESDDSINEYLIKASQQVESKTKHSPKNEKLQNKNVSDYQDIMEQDSMDNILKDLKFENSFLNTIGNNKPKCPELRDESVFEQLTQEPLICENINQNKIRKNMNVFNKELSALDSPSSKPSFLRHNSMPESPSVSKQQNDTKMTFGRHSTMPFHNLGDSPTKCTQDEIKKKHQQAKERLLAKRLPFTSQKNSSASKSQAKFESKLPYASKMSSDPLVLEESKNKNDVRSLIEKKRQEALLKLRSRRQCNNLNY